MRRNRLPLEIRWSRGDERGGAGFSQRSRRAIARRPSNCSRSSTMNFVALPPAIWPRVAGADAPGHGLGARGVSAAGWDDPDRKWNGRTHFFAAAAQAMRHILVETARRKARQKRGGGSCGSASPTCLHPTPNDKLLALDDALNRLAARTPSRPRWSSSASSPAWGTETATALAITVYRARQKWTMPGPGLARNSATEPFFG